MDGKNVTAQHMTHQTMKHAFSGQFVSVSKDLAQYNQACDDYMYMRGDQRACGPAPWLEEPVPGVAW